MEEVLSAVDAAPQADPPGEAGLHAGLKVAFIGTHGVGKTTLCFELAARLKRMDYRVDMVKEVARSCPLPLNRETTLEAQAWILLTQIAREIETSMAHDVVICDRSVLDNYAYLVAKCGRVEPYDALVASWLAGYSLLAWVPIVEDPRFDGVRDTDRSYQRRIHDLIEELVASFGVRPLSLLAGERDRWPQQVIDALLLQSPQLPLFNEDRP
jgi:nicotinamide riboside kinase